MTSGTSDTRDRYILLCQQALACAVVAAVAAPAAGVISLDIVSPSRTAAVSGNVQSALVAAAPVKPTVTEVPLVGVDRNAQPPLGRKASANASERLGGRPAALGALSAPLPVEGFATVGVTWRHGVKVDEDAIGVSVRTLKDGVWTGWEQLEYHDDHGPDAGTAEARLSRPGTEPYVIGDVDDVQVKAVTPDGTMPAGMRVSLVDPGTSSAPKLERPAIDTARLTAFESGNPADPGSLTDPSDPAEPALALTAAVDVTPQPQIFSRAQWGADERMRNGSNLSYGEVHAAFVHHTVNANDYTQAEVPAILRGIYAYHTQSRGWSDIGYNFLVDRFGRIWEGRYGGVGRPVIGAHTLNYNEYSFAMSAIGNFETAKPSAALVDAYGRLFAWKLSLHGVPAASPQQRVGARYFNAINGHRDAGKTACPGRYLYNRLAKIRALTIAYQRPFTSRNLRPNLSGSGWPDLALRDAATQRLAIVRTGGQVSLGSKVRLKGGFKGTDLIASAGDVNKDGYADVVAREGSTGVAAVYPGKPTGQVGAGTARTTKFKRLNLLVGAGDVNRDGRADLVGRSGKRLLLFPGKARSRFGDPVRLKKRWPYRLTGSAGDFNGDGLPDLTAIKGGTMYLATGTARGRFGKPRAIGTGFKGVDLLGGGGDVTNDGRADIVVRMKADRSTRIYTGDGAGGLGSFNGPYGQLKGLDWLAGGGQFAGSAGGDIVGRLTSGKLVAFPSGGGSPIETVVRTDVSLAGINQVLNVGDWNHDGNGDVMGRTTTGAMYLWLGKGGDAFAAPVVAGAGWSAVSQIVSVGDVTGDGHNDLMGRSGSAGSFMIWPGDGATGIGAPYVAHSAVPSTRQVAVGLYDGDGAPDTMTTRSDGSLWFYPGNGPGGMTTGRKVAAGFGGYDWLVGVGDLNGDGKSDLVGRNPGDGGLYLFAGHASGFSGPQLMGLGYGGYDLAG